MSDYAVTDMARTGVSKRTIADVTAASQGES